MTEKINFEELADEILDTKTDKAIIPSILDYHIKSAENKVLFLIQIMKELENRMNYSRRLRKQHADTIIRAGIGGKFLYLNTKAKEWQIFIIIGGDKCDVEQIILDFNKLMKSKTTTQRKSITEEFRDELGQGTEIILRNPYVNLLEFFMSDFNFKIGDSIKKNEVIGTIQHFSFSNSGDTENSRYYIARNHCSIQIKDLTEPPKNTKQKNKETLKPDNPLELKDIFLEQHVSKYAKIIALLAENHDADFPSPFIKTKGSEIKWEVGIKHSFSYLAGLFGVLRDLGWIYDQKESEFIEIAKRTFHVTINSRNAFQKMKTGNLDFAFKFPYKDIFKRIK